MLSARRRPAGFARPQGSARCGWRVGATVLRFQQVEKSFGAQPVLRGVTLDVPSGQTAALVGANGAGKSTLLHIAIGELAADRGQVLLPPGSRAAYLPQDAGVHGNRTLKNWQRWRWGWRPGRMVVPGCTRWWSARDICWSGSRRSAATGWKQRSMRYSPGSGSAQRISRSRRWNSPAAGRCASRWPSGWCSVRMCCCWMSRPTTWIRSPASGWRRHCNASRAPW